VESLALGLIGGTLGLALAHFGVRLLVATGPAGLPRLNEVTVGPVALSFAIFCSVTLSVAIGFAAALKLRGSHRVQSTRGTKGNKEQLRAQRYLVVGQVAIALVLLVACGLMFRTLRAIQEVAPGFTEPSQVQMVKISIPEALAKEPETVVRMQRAMIDKFRAIPSVKAAAFASALPLDGSHNGVIVAAEGKTDPDRMPPNRRYVHASPGLFAAQGTRLVAGRDFAWDEVLGERKVAIVSENMARETWGEPSQAIGKRIQIARGPWTEVVGVVENVHSDGLHLPAPTTVYARAGVEQRANGPVARRSVTFAIRSSRAGTHGFVAEVTAAVRAVTSSVPMAAVQTLEEGYRRSVARTSFLVALLGIAAVMAFAIALVGVYGILAYAVTERRHEVSIRLALGAEPSSVRLLFLRQGLLLACAGGVLGLVAAAGLSRWISSLLFGVRPLDPLTYSLSLIVLTTAAMAASYFPARWATAVDPMETLRGDQ
jgi:predicted permease